MPGDVTGESMPEKEAVTEESPSERQRAKERAL